MVTGSRTATIVGAAPRQAERVGWVVVARSPDHHAAARAGVRLPVAVGPIRIGAEDGERPLSQVAEHILDLVGARAVWPALGRLGCIVGAAEDREVRRWRGEAPGIEPPVVAARGLLPLGLAGQAPAFPDAVVARPEPRDFDHRMALESRIGDPPALDSVDPRVLVVLVVAALAAGRYEAGDVQEQGELGVRHLVALDPEVADVDAMLGRLVRWPVVAAHPEGASLDQHDPVRPSRRRKRRQHGGHEDHDGAAHEDHGIVSGGMRSRWNDAEASQLNGLDLLVYASRLVGTETSLVIWGGGNTSIKTRERDHRGRDIAVLRVKGSGSDLKSVQRKDFPGVRMDDIAALLGRDEMSDEEMVSYLAHALQEPGGVRPSIETLLHGFLSAPAIVHTHADAVVSLTNNDRAHDVVQGVYGKDVIALAYRRPGFKISRDVADAIAERPDAKALLLERHGTITWGATVREAYEGTIELITRAEDAIAERKKGRRVFGGARVPVLEPAARRQTALAVAPRLRGLLSRRHPGIGTFVRSPDVTEFVSSSDAPRVSQIGPATPDHTIYAKRLPCFVAAHGSEVGAGLPETIERSVERFVVDYTRYFEENRFEGAQLLDPLPRVLLVPGLGMFTAGEGRRAAGLVSGSYHHTPQVLCNAGGLRRHGPPFPADAFGVEYWPLELYKLTLAPPEKELARRIALVTGGGSGIGRAVARRLAAEGAHVVVGDIDAASAQKTADEIVATVGAGRALGLEMDVTREASVRAAFEETVLAYGGRHLLRSNAGIAHSSPGGRPQLAHRGR